MPLPHPLTPFVCQSMSWSDTKLTFKYFSEFLAEPDIPSHWKTPHPPQPLVSPIHPRRLPAPGHNTATAVRGGRAVGHGVLLYWRDYLGLRSAVPWLYEVLHFVIGGKPTSWHFAISQLEFLGLVVYLRWRLHPSFAGPVLRPTSKPAIWRLAVELVATAVHRGGTSYSITTPHYALLYCTAL